MIQYVINPTRSKHTPHIPDLTLSNDLNISQQQYHSPLSKSDHSVLVFNYCYAEVMGRDEIRYLYDKTYYDGLNNSIEQVEWRDLLMGNGDDDSI